MQRVSGCTSYRGQMCNGAARSYSNTGIELARRGRDRFLITSPDKCEPRPAWFDKRRERVELLDHRLPGGFFQRGIPLTHEGIRQQHLRTRGLHPILDARPARPPRCRYDAPSLHHNHGLRRRLGAAYGPCMKLRNMEAEGRHEKKQNANGWHTYIAHTILRVRAGGINRQTSNSCQDLFVHHLKRRQRGAALRSRGGAERFPWKPGGAGRWLLSGTAVVRPSVRLSTCGWSRASGGGDLGAGCTSACARSTAPSTSTRQMAPGCSAGCGTDRLYRSSSRLALMKGPVPFGSLLRMISLT